MFAVLLNQSSVPNYGVMTEGTGGPPTHPAPRRKTPSAFVVLLGISALTVLLGAPLAGVGMAVAVVLGWLLWRYVPEVEDTADATSDDAAIETRVEVGGDPATPSEPRELVPHRAPR